MVQLIEMRDLCAASYFGNGFIECAQGLLYLSWLDCLFELHLALTHEPFDLLQIVHGFFLEQVLLFLFLGHTAHLLY